MLADSTEGSEAHQYEGRAFRCAEIKPKNVIGITAAAWDVCKIEVVVDPTRIERGVRWQWEKAESLSKIFAAAAIPFLLGMATLAARAARPHRQVLMVPASIISN